MRDEAKFGVIFGDYSSLEVKQKSVASHTVDRGQLNVWLIAVYSSIIRDWSPMLMVPKLAEVYRVKVSG